MPGIRGGRQTLSRPIDRLIPALLAAGGLLAGILASLHPATGTLALGELVGVDFAPSTVGERA